MALTRPQARVLGALTELTSGESLTVDELHVRTGLSIRTTREAAHALDRSWLAMRSGRTPAEWRITPTGRTLAARPVYREETSRRPPGEIEIETKGVMHD